MLIGAVVRLSERTASLEPLYEISGSSPLAYRRIEDPTKDYPSRGRVVWFDPPRNAKERTIWQMEIVESATYRTAPRHADAFMVAQGSPPQQLTDVLDLRPLGDEDAIRRHITSVGVALTQTPSDYVYILVPTRRFIGPVHLHRVGTSHNWRLDPTALEEPLKCWEGDENDLLAVGTGPRKVLAASARAFQKVGLTDWNPDDLKVLGRVLKELRKIDPQFMQAAGLTARSIERLVSVLSGAAIPDRAMHEQRLRRIQALLPALQDDARLGQEVTENLLELPAVRAVVAQHCTTLEEGVRSKVTERVMADLAKEQRGLERLRSEGIEATRELTALRSEVDAQTLNLKGLVGSFERVLAERIAEIASEPQRFLAEVTLLRSALGLRPAARTRTGYQAAVTTDPESKTLLLSEVPQLRSALEISFQAAELSTSLWRILHGALLAGAVPALIGGRAADALRTYAACVTGGRLIRVPISAGLLSPWDLLDQRAIDGAATAPLADIVEAIGNGDKLALLVLENVNACPVDTTLLPLLQSHREGGGPLPPNVCVVATLTQGSVRLPLSPEVWEYFALVDLSGLAVDRNRATHPDRRNSPLPSSRVAPDRWQTFRASAATEPVARCAEVLGRLSAPVAPGLGVCDSALRVFAALRADGCDEGPALEATLAATVAPSFADRSEAFTAALSEQGFNPEIVRSALAVGRILSA